MHTRLKKAAETGKAVAAVLVFMATVGSAVYAAWFKPSGTAEAVQASAKSDVVYDTLKGRIAVNEAYFLTAIKELAVLRVDLDLARADLAALKKPAHTRSRRSRPANTEPAPPPLPDLDALDMSEEDGLVDVISQMNSRGALPEQIPQQQQLAE